MSFRNLYRHFPGIWLLYFLFIAQVSVGQITWDAPMDVASSAYGFDRPRIITNATGDPLVIWGKSGDLMFARWNETSFTTPVKLNPSGITIATANWMGPEIAGRGDTIYVVYKQTPEHDTNSHIWCRRSLDGGQNFDAPVRVENTGKDKSRFPSVAIDDEGHPIIAFMRFDSNFLEAHWVVTRSFDFGETFSPDVLASGWSGAQSEVCDCCPGTIISSGNHVAVVYRDNKNNYRDSWVGLSDDGGNTFTRGANIDQNGWFIEACPATGPDAIIIGDTLYSTFMNAATGQSLVYYNNTPINELLSDPSIAVPGEGSGLQQNFSRIASSGKAAALTWKHSANLASSLALLFTDDITKGFPASFDTVAPGNVINGDVAMTETNVYVAWQTNSGSNVKFRRGTYETSTSVKPITEHFSLTISPNPVTDELNLSEPAEIVHITNMQGQRIHTGQGQYIDVRHLSPGFYFVTTPSGAGKFIKL